MINERHSRARACWGFIPVFRPNFAGMRGMRLLITLLGLYAWSGTSGQSLAGGVISGGGDGGLIGGVVSGLMGLGSVLNTEPVDHPRSFEPRMLAGLGLTFQSAGLVSDSGRAKARALPSLGMTLEGGASVLWRERLELDLVGGWGLNTYVLSLDSVKQALLHGSKRAEVRLSWHLPAKSSKENRYKLSAAAGWTFQRADLLLRDKGGYRSTTTAMRATRPYLAAEIGRIGTMGKDRFEMSLRYVVHLTGDKAWEASGTLGSSKATWSATDNHLAIVARYHLGFKRSERPMPSMPAIAYEERAVDTLTTLRTHRRRIVLRLWDDAEIDGDTISILVNGHAVLAGHALTREPLRLAVDLKHGENHLTVLAHNEGTVPPNTLNCTTRLGQGRTRLLIKSSRKKSQTVVFQVE